MHRSEQRIQRSETKTLVIPFKDGASVKYIPFVQKELLATGWSSNVYLYCWEKLEVAVKIPRDRYLSNSNYVDPNIFMEKQKEILMLLAHSEWVIKLIGVSEISTLQTPKTALVFEVANGGDLTNWIYTEKNSNPLPWYLTGNSLATGLGEALDYL